MITEFRKSINSILYERVASPFYGTLIVTWSAWNWKIIYLTLFVDAEQISTTKIDFIVANYNDLNNLTLYPILSTACLLTLMPFVSNGAYWLDLKFKTWRLNQKNKIEGKQLLTIEQSIKLRTEIRQQEESFDKLLQKKNDEIEFLNKEIEELRKVQSQATVPTGKATTTQLPPTKPRPKTANKVILGNSFNDGDYYLVVENKEIYPMYSNVIKHVMDHRQFPDILENQKEFFLINEYVEDDFDAEGNKIFLVTFKGRELYKKLYNQKNEKK